MVEKTLMQELLDAGYPKDDMFSYESDLYIYVTPLTSRIVEDYYRSRDMNRKHHAPIFTSEVDGRQMYDCYFQYDDYWKEKYIRSEPV